MTVRVFVSYSHVDVDFASRLTRDLEKAGYDVWFDKTDIRTGSRWDDEIVSGLNSSQIFLVLLTNQSSASENVKDEIGYAIDHNKNILPILLETCEVPFRLRRIQYVDFSQKKYGDGFQEILKIASSFPIENSDKQTSTAKEPTMDPVTLATTLTTLLAPFLAKMGESFMEEAGSRLPEKIDKIWSSISDRFKKNPAASSAAGDLVKNPDDKDNQEVFALQLRKALKEDADFASLLTKLLDEAKKDVSISNVGGVVATNDSIGVKDIKIDGDVGGDFIIGKNIKGK